MHIAIVGAGLAGLTLANRLQDEGHLVQVFEKSRGSAGRMSTKRLAFGHVDFGAQYFTARDSDFIRLVHTWQQEGRCQPWQFIPFAQTDSGLQPSPDSTIRYVGSHGMSSVVKTLADNVAIDFQTHVASAHRTHFGWELHSSEHQSHDHNLAPDSLQSLGYYDWLICTQPLEQTRTLLKDNPMLTQLPEVIHQPCWALALHTRESESITSKIKNNFSGAFAKSPLKWITRVSSRPGNNHLPPGEEIWLCHFDALWSKQHDKTISPNKLVQTALDWLSTHVGGNREVLAFQSHYWRYAQNSSELGLDHSIQTSPTELPESHCVDVHQQLAIAGAWAAGGRVEGAFVSGRNCADTISHAIKHKNALAS